MKTAGLADVLREALSPLYEDIDVALVFGSIARGTQTASSDVDLLVVGQASFADVVKATAACHERLGREVNAVVMELSDFVKKHRRKDRFVDRILKEPKIFIKGASDELGELVKDRPA